MPEVIKRLTVPRITVGMTCFNAQPTIARALNSARAQTWPDLEIVVVDDCSTDTSWTTIEQLAAQDRRIKAIQHDVNGGPAASRNTILANATGAFVAFFDDDDESYPTRIETQFAAIDAYEKATGTKLVACFASGTRRYSNGYEVAMPAIGSAPEVPKGEEVAEYLLYGSRKDRLFYGAGTPSCALMAHAATYRAVGGFDSNLRRAEDVDFAVRLAIAGGHFIGCRDNLFLQHATIAADKSPERNLEAELYLFDKHADFLKSRKRYGFARAWFKIRYYHFSRQRLKLALALAGFLLRFGIRGWRQIMSAAPRRLAHERRMSGSAERAA